MPYLSRQRLGPVRNAYWRIQWVHSLSLILTMHTLPCLIVTHIFFSTTEIIGFYKVQCDIFNYSFIPLEEVACNWQFYSCEQLCLRCVNTFHTEVAKRYTNFTIRLLNFEWKITTVIIIVRIIRFIEVDKMWKIRYLLKKNKKIIFPQQITIIHERTVWPLSCTENRWSGGEG